MKQFLKTILLAGLCIFPLLSSCDIISDLLNGRIKITSPEDGAIVPASSVTVEVEATFDYIDEIILEVNGTTVHTTSDDSFSYTVYLDPDENTISVTCYAYESESDSTSEYVGSDTIYVYYDNQNPVLTITDPENWSIVPSADVTISGNVTDNYGIETLSYLDNGSYHSIPFDDITGDWELNLSGLSETTHSYLFKAEDIAGRSVVNAVTFTVDIL